MTVAHTEQTVTIDRPIADVFDFLADGTNNPRWRSGVLEISRSSAAEGQGATYRQVLQGPGGRHIDGDYRVTTFTPPHRLDFEVIAGPARPTGSYQLSEDGVGSTTLRFTLDLQPRGVMRLMSPVITKQMRREVAALEQLKHQLERHAT
jgi:uncharacterized protein YndB with AHSA1/START domain